MFRLPLDESAQLEELIQAYALSGHYEEDNDGDGGDRDGDNRSSDVNDYDDGYGDNHSDLASHYYSPRSSDDDSNYVYDDHSSYGYEQNSSYGYEQNLQDCIHAFEQQCPDADDCRSHRRDDCMHAELVDAEQQQSDHNHLDCMHAELVDSEQQQSHHNPSHDEFVEFNPSNNPYGLEVDNEDDFVEVDPSNRYGRYSQLLGKGAIKKVYRGFDKEEGIEVAWNQVDFPSIPHIESEVHFLETLKHKNIIKIYTFWVDHKRLKVNFITELCTNTLLGFRRLHRHVCMKAVKDWARQILRALVYLHSQNPPVIHRDLKCENIFVNSSNGKVKVGDFGSATLLDETRHLHTLVGTPEFMAPEMYMEDYNELVDIYAFGMCMIELLALETPYGECQNVAQIYQKVTNGVKPQALDKVKDVEAIRFIRSCLVPLLQRPSAAELLSDPFLLPEGQGKPTIKNLDASAVTNIMKSASSPDLVRMSSLSSDQVKKKLTSHASFVKNRNQRKMEVTGQLETESMFSMRLRIVQHDEPVPVRNVNFAFDSNSDTPQSVAEEMVQELHFPESDSRVIADLITSVIAYLKEAEGVSSTMDFGSQVQTYLKAVA